MSKVLEEIGIDCNKLVDKFRELARMVLRLRWINNIKDDIHVVDNSITMLEKEKENYTKEIARATFRLSKGDETNPDYPEFKDSEDKKIKYYAEMIEREDKNILEKMEKKESLNATIAKVESGELKVNAENLSAKAKELAEEWGKAVVKEYN